NSKWKEASVNKRKPATTTFVAGFFDPLAAGGLRRWHVSIEWPVNLRTGRIKLGSRIVKSSFRIRTMAGNHKLVLHVMCIIPRRNASATASGRVWTFNFLSILVRSYSTALVLIKSCSAMDLLLSPFARLSRISISFWVKEIMFSGCEDGGPW